MSEEREHVADYLANLAQQIIERGVDQDKLAAHEAARTDPWRWYCRLCGPKGAVDNGPGARESRDKAAEEHLRDTPCGRHAVTGWSESGRLLHVWTYPKSETARWN